MNAESPTEFEKIQHWRFYWDWLWSVGPMIAMAWICENIHFGFYFLFLYFLGNRFFRLATLGHEGLHHLISRIPWWNSFLGRYFCHFPVFASHSRYKTIHRLHHRFLGENGDPDKYIYKEFPEPIFAWSKRIIFDLVSLKIIYEFFEYFSEVPERIRLMLGRKPVRLILFKSDFAEYMVFWTSVIIVLSVFGWWKYFFLYWFIPGMVHFPIIQLANGLQHGAFNGPIGSRTLIDPYLIIDFIIPLDLNHHYEHHLNPRIPHYNLRAYGRHLRNQQEPPTDSETHMKVAKSIRSMFKAAK